MEKVWVVSRIEHGGIDDEILTKTVACASREFAETVRRQFILLDWAYLVETSETVPAAPPSDNNEAYAIWREAMTNEEFEYCITIQELDIQAGPVLALLDKRVRIFSRDHIYQARGEATIAT